MKNQCLKKINPQLKDNRKVYILNANELNNNLNEIDSFFQNIKIKTIKDENNNEETISINTNIVQNKSELKIKNELPIKTTKGEEIENVDNKIVIKNETEETRNIVKRNLIINVKGKEDKEKEILNEKNKDKLNQNNKNNAVLKDALKEEINLQKKENYIIKKEETIEGSKENALNKNDIKNKSNKGKEYKEKIEINKINEINEKNISSNGNKNEENNNELQIISKAKYDNDDKIPMNISNSKININGKNNKEILENEKIEKSDDINDKEIKLEKKEIETKINLFYRISNPIIDDKKLYLTNLNNPFSHEIHFDSKDKTEAISQMKEKDRIKNANSYKINNGIIEDNKNMIMKKTNKIKILSPSSDAKKIAIYDLHYSLAENDKPIYTKEINAKTASFSNSSLKPYIDNFEKIEKSLKIISSQNQINKESNIPIIDIAKSNQIKEHNSLNLERNISLLTVLNLMEK